MAVWSQLTEDVWSLIGLKLKVAGDRIRFRSVCKTWRSILPFPQPPWLMLAEDDRTPNTRGFFSLDGVDKQEQVVHQFELPEAYQTRCVGSTGTWLITIDLQGRIRLLNPFSRVQLDLPSQRTIDCGFFCEMDPGYELTPEEYRDSLVRKVILSSPPSSGDCVAMAIYFEHWQKLVIARPGDASWINVLVPVNMIEDIIFFRDRFYAVTHGGTLMVCDLGDAQNPGTANILTNVLHNFKKFCNYDVVYLVEWMGELLFVIKFMDDFRVSYKLNGFEVYVFNFNTKWWYEVKNLGEYSLFLGFNTSVAVLASKYSGLKRNCIYFTDYYTWGYTAGKIQGGGAMGVFDLEDKSIQLHYKGVSTSLYSPPIWIVP